MSDDLISDILENLEVLENLLLQYERTLRAGEGQLSLVPLMFRYAHNCKATLGMAGESAAQNLIHQLEAALDLVRTGKMPLDAELVDVLLTAVGELSNVLNDDLDRTTCDQYAASVEEAAKATLLRAASQMQGDEAQKYKAYTDQGNYVFRIDKLIATPAGENELEALPLLEDIRSVGEILSLEPAFTEFLKCEGDKVLSILFKTSKSPADLEFVIFDPMITLAKPEATTENVSLESAPIAPNVEPERSPIPIENSSPRPFSILVVEDDLVSRRILARALSPFGQCDFAADGLEGLVSFLLSAEENTPYDLICLDISMPNLDGRTLLKQIRRAEAEKNIAFSQAARVIMATGEKSPQTILGTFGDGCEGYLTKPFDLVKVKALVEKVYRERTNFIAAAAQK